MNVSVPEFVGDTLGDAASVGVGGALAANTANAPHTPTARTASNATSNHRLALPDALFDPLPAISLVSLTLGRYLVNLSSSA